jgi:arsenate reductase (glutaredoxin)
LLRAQGVEFDTVESEDPAPSHHPRADRRDARYDPAELVRKDRRFEDLGLKAADYVSAKAVVELLLKHPELMQRPVIVKGAKAVIARPPERLLALLGQVR